MQSCGLTPSLLLFRYANAVLKMQENDPEKGNGTSEYLRLSLLHGGIGSRDKTEYPHYCVHKREAFPGWHRAYLLDFERTLRRADVALGGDGNLGLPYWDWSRPELNGQVIPSIVRDRLMDEFADEFYPDGVKEVLHKKKNWRMAGTKSDDRIKAYLEDANTTGQANQCLNSLRHSTHSCTRYQTARRTSVENCHNAVHMAVQGIMGSFQSSFHPLFWLHHNNVDRIYEKYLELQPDSKQEYERFQKATGGERPTAGLPDGSAWGEFAPFKHPYTRAPFHAKDSFDIKKLGFEYDKLPEKVPPQMREAPVYAFFPDIDVTKMPHCASLFVYAVKKEDEAAWEMPTDPTDYSALKAHAGFTGIGSVFFLDMDGGCDNCDVSPSFNLFVDITKGLRELKIRTTEAGAVKDAVLKVAVLYGDDTICALEDTPIPQPQIKGPRFRANLQETGDKDDEDEVKMLQQLLPSELTEDGALGPKTTEAIKAFQKMARLEEDGVVGPLTQRQLLVAGLREDDANLGEKVEVEPGTTVTWSLDPIVVPSYLEYATVCAEVAASFGKWANACSLTFEQNTTDFANANIQLSFKDATPKNKFVFDGPGGALAVATKVGICVTTVHCTARCAAPGTFMCGL